jgi:hypothetical protein
MSAEKLYSEIFEDFDKCTTKNERIALLRKHDNSRFRSFLQTAFLPGIEFDVKIPKYRPAVEPAGLNFTYLDNEMDKIYRFLKNHPSRPEGLTPEKQSSLLVVILESLHKDEAELFVKLINRDLQIKFLTANLVKEAFPGLI